MSRVIVYHAGYGCESGCCGHVVELDGEMHFEFTHPFDIDLSDRDAVKRWACELIADTLGSEHVADLDWDNCVIVDD